MSLRKKKKLLRKKNSWHSLPHMKIRRILSPTILRIVKKKICSQPINFNTLIPKAKGEIQVAGTRAEQPQDWEDLYAHKYQ
jgi:hypothetical protein